MGTEALADQENLPAPVSRGPGLAHVDFVEPRPEGALQLGKTLSLESFDDQIAPGLQPRKRKLERQLTQIYALRLVRGFDTADIGRQIGEHKIDFVPRERRFQRLQRRLLPKIALDEGHTGDRLQGQQVERHDPATGPELLAKHLAPAPWRGAQVDDGHARPEELVPGGQLHQLEGCARPVAQPLRLVHPVVRNVLMHPGLAEFVLFTGGVQRFGAGAHIRDCSFDVRGAEKEMPMKTYNVTVPEIAIVAATRGMAGAGAGLLLAGFLRPETRRTLGWTLLAIGALTTIPIAMALFGKRERPALEG
jgi:hypothetical protein